MSSTETRETTLDELSMFTRRIREAKTSDDLRRLLNQMNDLKLRLPDDVFMTALYNYLRGVLYIKGAVSGIGWVASGGESLYYAIDLLEFAEKGFSGLMTNPSAVLLQFRQDCVYESMVAVTTLQAWGRRLPENVPDTGLLPPKSRRVIERHRSHGYPLRSRFA